MPQLFSRRDFPGYIVSANVVILVLTGLASAASSDLSFFSDGPPFRLIDSAKQAFSWAYAPSIIYADGLWYAYYCSSGTGLQDWDNIRHSTSSDGIHWSPPIKILGASDAVDERATCDPSVVHYAAGDGGYYYLLSPGNQTNRQELEHVSPTSLLPVPSLILSH